MEIFNFTAMGNSQYLAEHPHTQSGAYFKAEDVARLMKSIQLLTELKIALTQINLILDRAEAEMEKKRQQMVTDKFYPASGKRGTVNVPKIEREVLEDMNHRGLKIHEMAKELEVPGYIILFWFRKYGMKV